MSRFASLFLLFLLPWGAWCADDTNYLNRDAWDAQRITAVIIAADPQRLPTTDEKIEWAKARLAAISLARLQAKESEALKLFEGCGEYCEKYGGEAEWKAVKAWGCQKKRDTSVCLFKTKAQKPLQ